MCSECGANISAGATRCDHCQATRPRGGWPLDPYIGRVFAERYRVIECLGEGGMGRVYRAVDDGREGELGSVALKVLGRTDQGLRGRFLNEARIARSLSSPYAVKIYDIGVLDTAPFIVMELLRGITLREHLFERGQLSVEAAVGIARQVCAAMGEAHSAGIVHRDLKPDNLMLLAPKHQFVKVLDFGVAGYIAGPSATQSLVGTPHYMAPEQVAQTPVDGRTDIYSLGVTLFEMVTGCVPFDGVNTMEVMKSHLHSPIPAVPDVPPPLGTLIQSCLAKLPAERPQSMEEVEAELSTMGPSTVPHISTPPPAATSAGTERQTSSTLRSARRRSQDSNGNSRPGKRTGTEAVSNARTPRSKVLWMVPVAVAAFGITLALLRLWPSPEPSSTIATVPPKQTPSAIPITALPLPSSSNAGALQLYGAGLQALRDSNWELARAQFLEAIERDPRLGEAHLRLAIAAVFRSRPAEARMHLSKATLERETMAPRDRAVLEAMHHVVSREEPDWNAAVTRLQKATRTWPNDAELWQLLGSALYRSSRTSEALEPAYEAVRLDPDYADALQATGRALLRAHRWEEAAEMFDRCIEKSSSSVDCIWDRAHVREVTGDCKGMLSDIRLVHSRGVSSGFSFRMLAAGLLSTGHDWPAVVRAMRNAREHRTPAMKWKAREDELLLKVAQGELREAAMLARGLIEETSAGTQQLMIGTRHLLLIMNELGDEEAEAQAARDFIAARHSALSVLGVSPVQDPTPWALRALYAAGQLERDAYRQDVEQWIQGWQARRSARDERLWLQAWAFASRTEEDAKHALTARPKSFDARVYKGEIGLDVIDAQVHALSGHAQALPLLQRATKSCAWLKDPIPHLRGRSAMAALLERNDDNPAACKIYRSVLDAWGEAEPTAVTAKHARQRFKALRCSAQDGTE